MERFIEFCCAIKDNKIINKRSKNDKGITIHVFFDNDNFDDFCTNNTAVKQIYANIDEFDDTDTAVLSPDANFPFEYYSHICIYNNLSKTAKEYFDNLSADYIKDDKIYLPLFSVEEMRFTYKKLRELSFDPFRKTYYSVRDVYTDIYKKGYNLIVEKFVLYFYILNELKLLKLNNGDIIFLNTDKVNLSDSDIIGYSD